MRISDWSSDVCSSDLVVPGAGGGKIDIAAQCLADANQQVCLGPPGLDLRAAAESAVDAEALSEPGDECDVQVAQPGAAATENSEQRLGMGRNVGCLLGRRLDGAHMRKGELRLPVRAEER